MVNNPAKIANSQEAGMERDGLSVVPGPWRFLFSAGKELVGLEVSLPEPDSKHVDAARKIQTREVI